MPTLCTIHVVLAVEAAALPVSSTAEASAPIGTVVLSQALRSAASLLLLPRLLLVVGVVVTAVVGVVGRRGARAMGSASVTVAVALFTSTAVAVAFLLDVLLFCGRKEAPWDLFEESVREFGRTVVDSF